MMIGAADMGTGCDTILAQMAAEVLDCDADQISVFGADTMHPILTPGLTCHPPPLM